MLTLDMVDLTEAYLQSRRSRVGSAGIPVSVRHFRHLNDTRN